MRRGTSEGWVTTSNPPTSADPSVDLIRVQRIEIVVVFPAPFGPRNPNVSPSRIVKETLRTASISPYRLRRSRTSTTVVTRPDFRGIRVSERALERTQPVQQMLGFIVGERPNRPREHRPICGPPAFGASRSLVGREQSDEPLVLRIRTLADQALRLQGGNEHRDLALDHARPSRELVHGDAGVVQDLADNRQPAREAREALGLTLTRDVLSQLAAHVAQQVCDLLVPAARIEHRPLVHDRTFYEERYTGCSWGTRGSPLPGGGREGHDSRVGVKKGPGGSGMECLT